MKDNVLPPAPQTPTRLVVLDMARGLAMIAMTIFHFSWDLEFFGYAPPNMTSDLGWKLFARSIATSFLLIAGMSFMLAHINGVRWQSFWRRFAMVAGAAILISLSTYFTTPGRFVFFGILHQIAAASLIALLLVRLPAFAILLIGFAVVALPFFFRAELFLEPYFWWTGLAPYDPPSNDYVPVFPWTGIVLVGMAIAKFAMHSGLLDKLSSIPTDGSKPGRLLSFLGRHSLIYYLVHQPVMMAALYGLTLIVPPAPIDQAALFTLQCTKSCEAEWEKPFCERFCACVKGDLESQGIFQEVLAGKRGVSNDLKVLEITSACTVTAQ
ncbi:MAG: heparan-alpha-glucosaminide N-acetyltransferase [Rhizobiaceae bacterium]